MPANNNNNNNNNTHNTHNTCPPEEPAVIAAVEAGGTSFVVAICDTTTTAASNAPLPTIRHRIQIESHHDNPDQTLRECAAFLRKHRPPGGYDALGLGCFGPLGVVATTQPVDDHHREAEYGCILDSSPKAAWRKVDVLTPLREACRGTGTSSSDRRELRVKIDTDVNAPAWAEYRLARNSNNSNNNNNNNSNNNTDSSHNNLSSLAYITVGTGIGVGLVVNHLPVHGRMHPEGGHVPVIPLVGDTFGGYSWGATAPFGGRNTVEGLASSVALTERYQQQQQQHDTDAPPEPLSRDILVTLSDDDPLWDHAANALANLCTTLLLTLSIERVVLGGGLMQRPCLLSKIRHRTLVLLNGYLPAVPGDPHLETVIVTSQFGNDAGLMGTVLLAQSALLTTTSNSGSDKKSGQDDQNTEKLKQAAFGVGLWHGFLVGAVATAVVCKYWFLPRTSHR